MKTRKLLRGLTLTLANLLLLVVVLSLAIKFNDYFVEEAHQRQRDYEEMQRQKLTKHSADCSVKAQQQAAKEAEVESISAPRYDSTNGANPSGALFMPRGKLKKRLEEIEQDTFAFQPENKIWLTVHQVLIDEEKVKVPIFITCRGALIPVETTDTGYVGTFYGTNTPRVRDLTIDLDWTVRNLVRQTDWFSPQKPLNIVVVGIEDLTATPQPIGQAPATKYRRHYIIFSSMSIETR